MGAKLCTLCLRHPKAEGQFPAGARDGKSSAGLSFTGFIKTKCLKIENRRRSTANSINKMQRKAHLELAEKKIVKARKLTLEDWLLASPGLKPEYLRRGELCVPKHSKKRVHPSSSQNHRSLLNEVRDSLTQDRPMIHHEEGEEKPESSLSISRNSSGISQKRVNFKLPNIVIFYSPDEPHCGEATLHSPEDPYYSSDSSEGPFSSPEEPDCGRDSLDAPDEPCFRLAVDTLPHVPVSSSMRNSEIQMDI